MAEKIKVEEKHHEHASEKLVVSKVENNKRRIIFLTVLVILVVGAAIGGWIYLQIANSRVYIEKSEINAPIILLKPNSTGILSRVFVSEADFVTKNMIVAMVGNNSIKATTNGIVLSIKNAPGQLVTTSDTVVSMIDPNELRLVGHLEEDKGLKEIKPGQNVVFTADAFDSKKYTGVVDLISVTSRQSDIVFSISDKRQEQVFDVKVKYDVDAYPELKNGMSAKMWVYK
jgi:multidrug resistance efflux pump